MSRVQNEFLRDSARIRSGAIQTFLPKELIFHGFLSAQLASEAENIAQLRGLRLADVLTSRFGISQYSIALAQSTQYKTQIVDPVTEPPDTTLIREFGATKCLQTGIIPWRKIGGYTIILSARPDEFAVHIAQLSAQYGPIRMAITTDDQLGRAIAHECKDDLVANAETKTPVQDSCRDWNPKHAFFVGITAFLGFLLAFVFSPVALLGILVAWAILTLIMTTALKIAAAIIGWQSAKPNPNNVTPARLPVITMLVPLYNETAIAEHLLARLTALNYPRELLEVCLVLEADDLTTRATLGRTTLPQGIRPIIVPKGAIKTKPRALNYALDFARGSIIGVWDAEDAPAPDQLHKVADEFANAAPDVVCLQGKLDYYNASANWLTRCFTIEYASWFRVILPGLQRLGLAVPLGGTTLFFKRDALHELGGWDAHNVTEDADLGIRLARHGYRTALIDTVTEEEANGRAWPWVKQRSRWLKGYAITYGVHMRDPIQLWRDLGAWRFFGVQLLFLGTLSQFVLAPLLWTFWLPVLGVAHPLSLIMQPWAFWMLSGLFIISELIGWIVTYIALGKANKSWLFKWAFTLSLYFPLGALAAYKGIYELVTKPFYWDKTAHGLLLPQSWKSRATPQPQPLGHPTADG
ncbi:cellulose synthase/poly-beta-1,6-N-acetylglucosamine synthase-like glycosyltransferase [Yoonia maritima]|uniref:Cellulose synthase/poly-beta-1,6-N-acetylglucosamine synthase-like glycosyltransferase n=1 Tax=Yoonia maritima TaxID=1435347 RepID=A0A2T0W0T7_9RHOB|nr:glycosyltransferase family 2 protein [Yoonia maritima]PRY78403.1 cellulose synthase/poly-beta-1,6-N-acetylglucosamine synthase-like glycosyltransferase [Yoonia maritima]